MWTTQHLMCLFNITIYTHSHTQTHAGLGPAPSPGPASPHPIQSPVLCGGTQRLFVRLSVWLCLYSRCRRGECDVVCREVHHTPAAMVNFTRIVFAWCVMRARWGLCVLYPPAPPKINSKCLCSTASAHLTPQRPHQWPLLIITELMCLVQFVHRRHTHTHTRCLCGEIVCLWGGGVSESLPSSFCV